MGRLWIALLVAGILIVPDMAAGTPEYSARTAQPCRACHLSPEGGALNSGGLEFAASGYVWPPTGGYRVIGPMRKSVRVLVGYLHVLGAFIWFGAILYVHLLLRPGYASKGLPRGEVMLGLSSMLTVGVTGLLLTISRVRGMGVLLHSPWGIVLSVKILLYSVMILSAACTVLFIGPRLKKGAPKAVTPPDGIFDPVVLAGFDGREGRPAYFAHKGKVYDATGLKLWPAGVHMIKHHAGEDLTQALGKAPHGEEKLSALRQAGEYDPSAKPRKTPAQRAFYFVAYMNLSLVFVVLLVIALWRWGL